MGGPFLPERLKWQLVTPPFPCLSGQHAFRLGPFFPFSWEIFIVKDWGRVEECLFHASLLCLHPQHGSWAPPFTPPGLPRDRAKEERLQVSSSVHISGERFHLPNPSPTICPQRGKGTSDSLY